MSRPILHLLDDTYRHVYTHTNIYTKPGHACLNTQALTDEHTQRLVACSPHQC